MLGDADCNKLGPIVLGVHIIADIPLLVPVLICCDVDKVETVRS